MVAASIEITDDVVGVVEVEGDDELIELVDESVDVITDIEQGPPGADGATGGTYVHTQATASDFWVVQHNLGYEPGGIEVEDDNGNRRNPSVQHVSINTLMLFFLEPVKGKARLS